MKKYKCLTISGIIMIFTGIFSIFICVHFVDIPSSFYDPEYAREINEFQSIGALTGILASTLSIITGITGAVQKTIRLPLLLVIIQAVLITISSVMLKSFFIILLPLIAVTTVFLIFSIMYILRNNC